MSRVTRGTAIPRPEDVSRVAGELTSEGKQVQLLRSVFVPEDELCFYLFDAESTEVVAETARRSGLRFERLLEAVSDWMPTNPCSKENPRAIQETAHRP